MCSAFDGCGSRPDATHQPSGLRLEIIEALFQDQLVQLQIHNDLFKTLIFLLQRFHLRELRPTEPPELLAPIVIGFVRNPSLATGAHHIKTVVQVHVQREKDPLEPFLIRLTLAQYLQRILI